MVILREVEEKATHGTAYPANGLEGRNSDERKTQQSVILNLKGQSLVEISRISLWPCRDGSLEGLDKTVKEILWLWSTCFGE